MGARRTLNCCLSFNSVTALSIQLGHILISRNAEHDFEMSVQMCQIDKSVFGHGGIDILGPLDGLLGMLHLAVQEKLIGGDAGMALKRPDKLVFGESELPAEIVQLQHMVYAAEHHFLRTLHKLIICPLGSINFCPRDEACQFYEQLAA